MDESLLLNGEERDRLKVLHEVRQGHITQRQAAEQLKLSRRWVKELVRRLRAAGDAVVRHGLKGRKSNRKIDVATEKAAVALIRAKYRDYGPTQAAEVLSSEHGISASRETVRKWMSAARIWRPKRARIGKAHVWRPRRERRGELVQWDTSEHDWLEGRGPKLYLIAMIDDATSELTARFAVTDSTEENMRLMWMYLKRHGRPGEFYTDKASLFTINRPLHYNKHLPAEPGKTQIGRALEELGIGWIAAHSPQAKGRIERCFGTLQDRLVKAMRREGIMTLEDANRYLDEVYLPMWNRRYRKQPVNGSDAHRPLRVDQCLASILSHVDNRGIANDYTISWRGQHYRIPSKQAKARMRNAKVRVEQRLDGTLIARFYQQEYVLEPCVRSVPVDENPSQPKLSPRPKPKAVNHNWMRNFHIGDPHKRATAHKPAQSSPTGSGS